MNNSKVIVLIIADDELKTFKIFTSNHGIDNYLNDQIIDCVDSNKEFSYVILDENDLKTINTTFTEQVNTIKLTSFAEQINTIKLT